MKHKETKRESKYKTNFDEWIGKSAQNIYNKIGIAGTILLSLILFSFSIIFFIRLISNNYWEWFNFDLSNKNEVGDALGGLTAPFIGLLGAFCTFIAFWVQYKFNQKQFKFYQNDKLDRKVDETNQLIETIIKNDSTIFTENKISPHQTSLEAFKLIEENYLKDNLINIPYVYAILVNHFTDAFIDFYDDRINDLDEKDVKKAMKEYINALKSEAINLRRILYYFLKEINKYGISRNEKIEIIESFIQRFSLLNAKFNSNIVYVYFSAYDEKYKAATKRNTEEDQSIIKDITDRLILDNSEDSKKSLIYLSEKLVKSLNDDK